MNEDYNPNSIDATLSRIETKLNNALATQEEHATAISKLWAAFGRIDVRVAGIAAGITVLIGVAKLFLFK